ncbi:hypothetical protein MVEN_00076400 [Mycena venus]|uniref:Uncharacterized protein n=1 Tax=Mycena venus TaxID=2733690 RepID=A0A8H6Z4H6_9AGAR|nr:hypothetical protein MVEN_00076400 [Mycena venus]
MRHAVTRATRLRSPSLCTPHLSALPISSTSLPGAPHGHRVYEMRNRPSSALSASLRHSAHASPTSHLCTLRFPSSATSLAPGEPTLCLEEKLPSPRRPAAPNFKSPPAVVPTVMVAGALSDAVRSLLKTPHFTSDASEEDSGLLLLCVSPALQILPTVNSLPPLRGVRPPSRPSSLPDARAIEACVLRAETESDHRAVAGALCLPNASPPAGVETLTSHSSVATVSAPACPRPWAHSLSQRAVRGLE